MVLASSSFLSLRLPRALVLSLISTGMSGCSLIVGDLPPKGRGDASVDAVEIDAAGSSEATDAETFDDAAEVADAAIQMLDAAQWRDAEGPRDAAGRFDAADAADWAEAGDAAGRDSAVADAARERCDGGVAWYADGDGDGFGAGEARLACPQPVGSWVRQNGDCQDQDPRVFPGQPRYFGEPYHAADGNDSYDYDCSGFEEGNPQQPDLRDGCGVLELTACQGSGYVRTQRTGFLRNSLCGSKVIDTCEAKLLQVLLCGSTSQSTDVPYLCR